MSLLQDVQPILDARWGLPLGANGGRDNIAVTTATMLMLMNHEEREAFRIPTAHFLHMCEIAPGLLLREPGNPDRNSVDNVTAAAVCSAILRLDVAERICDYGAKHWWSFSTTTPGKFQLKDCYLYHLGTPPFLRLAAGKPAGIFGRFAYGGADLWTLYGAQGDVGNKCLQYLMNCVAVGHHFSIDATIEIWQDFMWKKYPRGLKELYGIYFGEEHCFTRYAQENFSLRKIA